MTQTRHASPDARPDAPDAPTLASLAWRDTWRMAALSLVGCALVAVVELAGAVVFTPAPEVGAGTVLRLAAIDVTLVALLWALLLMPAMVGTALGARLVLALGAPARARTWPGLLAPGAGSAGPHPLAAWLWAGSFTLVAYLGVAGYASYRAISYFKEKQLLALLIAVLCLVVAALLLGLGYLIGLGVRALARRLDPRLGRFNIAGRVGPALVALVALAAASLRGLAALMPQIEPIIPWRHLGAAVVFAIGVAAARRLSERRGAILPLGRRQRTRVLGAVALGAAVVVPLTLVRVGADHEAKSVAMTGSPLLGTAIDAVRVVTDVDGDGYGFLLGENDCAPFDPAIHPLARDIAENGIDEDCNGRDFSFARPPVYKKGERMSVPPEFVRDWNILLITVDTVRYDHTGFGGYIEKRDRDTTPNLDQLVERSVSFTFANAPSAGTMASIPAILTSKFFHSGIALDEDVKPRMPPRLRPENVLLSELLRDHGYYNGAILSHEYFNDWGMEQGFHTYDNEIGKTHAPFKVTSHDITDKAIAWVAQNSKRPKWFLWTHYIDPHGRYVAHPGEKSFGTTEEDLYDGELYYTDKHIGRLLRELSRMPGAERTVIIITSDHGDGFNEHGFINHGQALYRELLHVPLIIHIPGVPPRRVDGAVSPLDIVPTVCDLVGIDTSELSFEGESLTPQLFYQRDAHHRVVFAETNWPRPLRAAITSKYKLIYKLKGNVYEFYDLEADPWEQRNVYNRADKEALGEMKAYLDDWLERVYYSRDMVTNQAAAKLRDFILGQPPDPAIPVEGVAFDDGRIEVIGVDPDRDSYKPGDKIRLAVYFRVKERPSGDFRLQVEGWPVSDAPEDPAAGSDKPGKKSRRSRARRARSQLRFTARGLFPTSRWRPGEHIRDRFAIRIPTSWRTGDKIAIGLRMTAADRRTPVPVTGPTRPGNDHVALLGEVGYQPPAEPAPDR